MRLVHGEPDKGYAKAFERRIKRKAFAHPLLIQFPSFLSDCVPDTLNRSKGGENGVGTAIKAGAQASCSKGRGTSGAHQIEGCGKDPFFCDSNRSCHNQCSVSVHNKSKNWSRNVQPDFRNNPKLSTSLSI
nr:hypothetical protein [uncultured bacterium]